MRIKEHQKCEYAPIIVPSNQENASLSMQPIAALLEYGVFFSLSKDEAFFNSYPHIQGLHDVMDIPLPQFISLVEQKRIPWVGQGKTIKSISS